MNPWMLAYGVAAGISAYAGVVHLMIGFGRRPRDLVHVSFAVVALLSVGMTIATWAFHSADSLADYVAILRGPFSVFAVVAAIAFAWFVSLWTGFAARRFLAAYSALGVVLLVVNFSDPQGLILQRVTELQFVELPGGGRLSLHVAEGTPSLLVAVFNVTLAAYLVVAVAHQWRTSGRRAALPLALALTVFTAASAYDSMVDAGVFRTPYLLSFGALTVVVIMSRRLSAEMVSAERALAQHREKLEELVAERTKQLEHVNADLAGEVASRRNTQERLRRRVIELDALHRIARLTATVQDLPAALRSILNVMAMQLPAEIGLIAVDQLGQASPTVATWRADGAAVERAESLAADLIGRLEYTDASRARVAADARYGTLLVAPLVASDAVIGAIVLIGKEDLTIEPADLRLAEIVAHDVAELVERAGLLERLRDTATAEERNRIARDLHDSVTQTLYSLSMMADALPHTFDRDRKEARSGLAQLRALTLSALAEMRSLLLELRPAGLEQTSLSRLLHEQGEAFMRRTRIPVDIAIRGEPAVSAEHKLALYRILGELLNNVARHAGASRVVIRLDSRAGGGMLEVMDDGCGFDPAVVGPGHFGFGIIRERLARMNGDVAADSRAGHGAQVTVTWPRSASDSSAANRMVGTAGRRVLP